MSDCAANRPNEKEDFQVLLSKRDVGESSYHKHSLWMAHWTTSSSNAGPQNGKSHTPFEEIGNGNYTKNCRTLPFQLMKDRIAEIGASAGTAQQFTSNIWGIAGNICQEVENKNSEQDDRSFESSMMQKDVKLYAAQAVVSKTISVCKLSDLSLNSQEPTSSDNQSSEWSHFPMFEINQKLDSILNPKRRSVSDNLFVPQQSLKVNMSTSNVMAFSSQEYQFHSRRITDEMDQCKSTGGILSPLEDHIGLNFDPAGQKPKGNLSIARSCSCSKDENNSSNSLEDEHHASHYFANSKQEPPHCSSENKSNFSAKKSKRKIAESTFWKQRSATSGAHQKQQDAAGVLYCTPVLGREYDSNNSQQADDNLHGTYRSHPVAFASPLHDEQQHLNRHRMDSAANLTESYKLSDAAGNMLTVKGRGDALTQGKQSMVKYIDSGKRKGPCLFEMLTLPSKSHGTYSKDSPSSGKSSDYGICMYGTNIGSHLLGAQNQCSARTDTLYSDTHHASKSLAGFSSTSAQKDSGCPNSTKTDQLAIPSVRGVSCYSKDNEYLIVNEEHLNSSSKGTSASKQERSMSKTANMNLDLVLFQINRMRNPISNALIQSAVCSQPSNRWLKRLQHDTSDPHVPRSKKPKVGDGPPARETSRLFSLAVGDDKGNTNIVKEHQLSDEKIEVQCNREGSPVPERSLNCWIGRWCQGGIPIIHESPDQGAEATKSDPAPQELEGQFPSIAAMAMMGRAMTKLRPCELQRRGASVVWKAG